MPTRTAVGRGGTDRPGSVYPTRNPFPRPMTSRAMDSGGEEPEAEDADDEPGDPSIADLVEGLEGGAEEPPEPSSFADLVSEIRRRRSRAPPPEEPEASAGAGEPAGEAHPDSAGSADAEHGAIDWGWQGAATSRSADTSVDRDAVLELVGDAPNVLLVGELLSPAEDDLCTTLLGAARPANIVLVTLTQSPDERLAMCRRHLGQFPGRTAVVNVGDPVRSGDGSGRATGRDGSIIVESVADPTDLMRIGITISRRLAEFEGDDLPTLICFHSLTTLMQFVEDQRSIFRFIHTLRGRVRAAGAQAHYHVDGQAHDDQEVALLRPLFDVTLQFDDQGAVSSRTFP